SPAYAKTLKRSAVTCWRSTRYPSELRWTERNSPISLSLPVTDGIDINRFVSSNGFISTFQSGGNSLAGKLTLVTQKMYDTVPVRFCEFDLIVFSHFGLEKDLPDFSQCGAYPIADLCRHCFNRAELLNELQGFFRADTLDAIAKVRTYKNGEIHQLRTCDAIVFQQRAGVDELRYNGPERAVARQKFLSRNREKPQQPGCSKQQTIVILARSSPDVAARSDVRSQRFAFGWRLDDRQPHQAQKFARFP